MKYKNFNQVPSSALVGAQKDLLTKLGNGSILFEEFTAYLKAPNDVRERIQQLLGVGIVNQVVFRALQKFSTLALSKKMKLFHLFETELGVDPEILQSFPHAVVSVNPAPQAKWKNYDADDPHVEKILLQRAKKIPLLCAISKFTEELKKGTFDTFGTERIILLEEKYDGDDGVLICMRNSDGILYLSVYDTKLEDNLAQSDSMWLE